MSLLELRDISVHHGQLRAVHDFSLTLNNGERVAVIGANGAGKTTVLRAIAGTVPVSQGQILIDGVDITDTPAHRRVERGIGMVPEGRRLFRSLSLEENLLTGAYRKRSGPWDIDAVFGLFDWMKERRKESVSHLSGGQQQMVAIGRALMSNPRVVLIDELSLGLAPTIIRKIYAVIPKIIEGGSAVLFVEQDVSQALQTADRALCLLEGKTMLQGNTDELDRAEVEAAYFGAHGKGA